MAERAEYSTLTLGGQGLIFGLKTLLYCSLIIFTFSSLNSFFFSFLSLLKGTTTLGSKQALSQRQTRVREDNFSRVGGFFFFRPLSAYRKAVRLQRHQPVTMM